LDEKMLLSKGQIKHVELVLLVKAFRGELAPQDPNDGPVSVLLERIRALGVDVGRNKRSVSNIRAEELPYYLRKLRVKAPSLCYVIPVH
jgi:hypothetical protein